MQKEPSGVDKKAQFRFSPDGENSERKIHSKEKALQISIKEGSAATFSGGMGDSYVTPFALSVGATPLQIGFLSSITGLLSPLAQLLGCRMMEKQSRKTIVTKFIFLQAILWLPIALLAFLYFKGIFQNYAVYTLIVLYSSIIVVGAIASPSWFSWMGDIVPADEKGRYFARRNKITGIVGLTASLIAAFFLDMFKTRGLALVGFTILFSLAFTFRFISFMYFKKQYNPKFKLKKDYYFTIWAFLKRYDNFGKFAVYMAFFNFSIMIASPFFAVYMLKELNFSYSIFMIISVSSTIFYLLFTPLIGRFSDKFGNKKLLYLSGILFALNPILWLFSKSPIWLIFVPQLVTGLANAAQTLPANNFMYDSVSPQKRGLCSAYLNMLSGIGIFIGSLLGGLLANHILIDSINPFVLVFAIAAFARLTVTLYFLPKLKDERKVKRLPPMHINFHHPFRAVHSEIGWLKHVLK